MLSLHRCRQILGSKAADSDDAIKQVREALYTLAYIAVDVYAKALFMTVWRPSTRSAEHSCGIRQG